MADNQRIDDLRRRVQKDPASIAFAQLAEECRRAGQYEESIEVCRAGLDLHPAYLSARVTLGRALIEINSIDEAQIELEFVLKSAPENLAAIRGLAEIHHRREALPEALAQYRAALLLARNDPDLQQTVADLERIVEPPTPPVVDGLSFEQVELEFLKHLPPPPAPVPAVSVDAAAVESDASLAEPAGPEDSQPLEAALDGPTYVWDPATATPVHEDPEPLEPTPKGPPYIWEPDAAEPDAALSVTEHAQPAAVALEEPPGAWDPAAAFASFDDPPPEEPVVEPPPYAWPPAGPVESAVEDSDERERAMRTIGALEQFLDAIHVSRTQPGA